MQDIGRNVIDILYSDFLEIFKSRNDMSIFTVIIVIDFDHFGTRILSPELMDFKETFDFIFFI